MQAIDNIKDEEKVTNDFDLPAIRKQLDALRVKRLVHIVTAQASAPIGQDTMEDAST